MPEIDGRPKLVNRGGAGLLSKLSKHDETAPQQVSKSAHRIVPELRSLAVAIDLLIPDPCNARLHPERNMEAIRQSLEQYGQCKPIVVRKQTMIIVAGNGTVEAAKQLGWSEVAAVVLEMTDVEAAGYGLADNRTAELAKWDFEIVARLDRLLLEAGHANVGWSKDELEVLRAADWTPPQVDEGGFDGEGSGEEEASLLVSFSPDQYSTVGKAIAFIQAASPDLDQAESLEIICRNFMESVNA